MVTNFWLCSKFDQKGTRKMETVYKKVPYSCLEVSKNSDCFGVLSMMYVSM